MIGDAEIKRQEAEDAGLFAIDKSERGLRLGRVPDRRGSAVSRRSLRADGGAIASEERIKGAVEDRLHRDGGDLAGEIDERHLFADIAGDQANERRQQRNVNRCARR